MDELLPQILTFPPVPLPAESLSDSEYEQSIVKIRTRLEDTPRDVLAAGVSNGEDVLNVLDPARQSLAYLVMLWTQIEAARATSKIAAKIIHPAALFGGHLWPRISMFLEVFDPIQVRYLGMHFRKLLELVYRGAVQTQNPLPAIPLIRHAILRLDPSSSTLSSNHHLLIRLCLEARAFQEAIPFLERPIYHISASMDDKTSARSFSYLCSKSTPSWVYLDPKFDLSCKLSPLEYLEYHLYAGMVYMGLKQWRKAMSFLEIVILTPSGGKISSVMVEAYKKWLLSGVLLNGEAPTPPRSISKNNLRNLRALARPYDCLVEAFASGNLARLKVEVQEGQSIWLHDCNFGLVIQVLDALQKFSVVRLAKIYTALPLSEVARIASPDGSDLIETVAYITSLIASGDLKATLTQPPDPAQPAILRFTPPEGPGSEHELHRSLQRHQNELGYILKFIQDNEYRLELTKDYIDKLRNLKQLKEQAKKAGESSKPVVDTVDEDVMGS